MANQVFEEQFVGKYDGVTPATLLAPGSLVGGANVRKVSPQGGWKVRKGCALHNTTAVDSTNAVSSLHQYTNPRSSDYHFIAQCNSLLYDATKDPPDLTGTTFGSSLGVTVGTTPGFSCLVKEDFFYADGSGRPIAWGGDTPYCIGFLVWDNSVTTYNDFTRVVTDSRTTIALLGNAASDVYYVGSSEIASGIVLDLVTVNTTDTAVCKVYSWVAGAWQERSTGYDDGTLAGGKTHAQDGTIAWTVNATDTMSVLGGIMAYWYKVEPQSTYLTDGVTVKKCQVVRAAALMTNKWNGVYEYVAGCRFFDQSSGEYDEALGKVSNESTSQYIDMSSATTSDFLYFKTFEPAYGVGLAVVTDYTNTDNAQVDLVEYWNGSAWTTCGTLTDTTLDTAADSSFGQTGVISWNAAALSPKRRTWQGDQIPGYWYRISWDAALSASVRIYLILHIPFPEVLPTYDGCVEFKGRLFLWGDPEFPNRFRYSAYGRPDCFSGSDSGWTDEFGGMDKVVCAVPFYNELIVFKKESVWLFEGYSPQTFGALRIADTVGLASPKTALVVEVGSPSMHQDEPMSIAIWQDVDGVYVLDGRKPRKASMPIDHYFNTEHGFAIAATSIRDRQAFVDTLNNEYHFLLPGDELVYNYAADEWYPPWKRGIDLVCGLNLRGTDGREYVYGGSGVGFVMKLEDDTSDKTTADADAVIVHSIKTRAIGLTTTELTSRARTIPVEFTLRKLWANLKARPTGDIVTKTFKNMEGFGVVQKTPQVMSLGSSIDLEEDCSVITPWTDNDNGTGAASTQVIYDSRDCFKFDSGSAASSNRAQRYIDLGTFDDKISAELRIYHDALGTRANMDCVIFSFTRVDAACYIAFASDGLFVYDGTDWNKVGTNIVSTGVWTDWKFEADFTILESATVDVYKNGVLQAAGVDCSWVASVFENFSGFVYLSAEGETTANRISYVDCVRVRSGSAMVTPGLDLSEYRCTNFQVEFSLATADEEMEIWSMPWEAEVRGELGIP